MKKIVILLLLGVIATLFPRLLDLFVAGLLLLLCLLLPVGLYLLVFGKTQAS